LRSTFFLDAIVLVCCPWGERRRGVESRGAREAGGVCGGRELHGSDEGAGRWMQDGVLFEHKTEASRWVRGSVSLLKEGRFREGAAVLVLRRDEHDVDVSCSLTQPPNAKTLSRSSTTRTSTASPPVRRRYRGGRLFDMPWHRSRSDSAITSSPMILIDATK
jgi:hypothetical protein